MANLATAKQKAADADAQQGTGGLLTKKVDAAAKGLLAKKVNPNQQWQVILVPDKSYSMEREYQRGTVQEVVERTLGFAVIVDDDGSVPAVFFGGNIADYTIQLSDFSRYIERNHIGVDGSTPLTEALAKVANLTGNGDLLKSGGGLFRRDEPKPSVRKMDTPAYVVIVTDGVPNDKASATDIIRKLSYRGLFLKFLYVGNDAKGWAFLESLDDDIPVGVPYEQGGRLIDNVDAKNLGNISSMSDEDFYAAMFDEAGTWLTAARTNGLI
jgi:Mg-chelatase subunit ChlD